MNEEERRKSGEGKSLLMKRLLPNGSCDLGAEGKQVRKEQSLSIITNLLMCGKKKKSNGAVMMLKGSPSRIG